MSRDSQRGRTRQQRRWLACVRSGQQLSHVHAKQQLNLACAWPSRSPWLRAASSARRRSALRVVEELGFGGASSFGSRPEGAHAVEPARRSRSLC